MLLFSAAAPAADAAQHRIAAVVEEEIISMLEVEDRMRMIIATTGLSDSKEVRQRLLPQVVRSLIDETLQGQAAEKAGIQVSEAEVAQATAAIEKQRGRAPGSLLTYLKERGVPAATFQNQLKAQIAWSKLIGRKVTPRVAVSQEELTRRLEEERRQRKQAEEVQLSVILLPVNTPEQEVETKKLAERLAKEIQGGASFEAVASQLSQGPRPMLRLWVDSAQLDPVIAAALAKQQGPGLLSPLRTTSGYHILALHDRRGAKKKSDPEVLFKEIVLALDPNAQNKEVDTMMDVARMVAKHPGACRQKGVAGLKDVEGLDIKVSYARTRFSALSPEVLPLVEKLPVEGVSEPFAAPDGIHLLMLCERVEVSTEKPDIAKLKDALFQEKLELEAMRYLRDLRREAFIEVRI